jgi:L-ascorbate metabolism protein UlaG (beta-lactamase superfamily)
MIYNNVEIELLAHASFKLKYKENIIYIDPFELDEDKEYEKGSIILITHEHYDHCSPKDIEMLSEASTLIIAPKGAAAKLRGNIRTTKTGEKITIGDVIIDVVSAYNKDKPFHPIGLGVGYVITLNNSRFYHTGDTDLIQEMKQLGKIDVVFIPVSGVYVMNPDEAAEAIDYIKPKIAIPMHYGSIVGSKTDAEMFEEMADCEVRIISNRTCKPGECEARGDE